MFSSDQPISPLLSAPLADEAACEELAKAAIDYAVKVLDVDPDGAPDAWQSNYLCVIEDAIIHHIDWALETETPVSEFEKTLTQFIDHLGLIYHTTRAQTATISDTIVH